MRAWTRSEKIGCLGLLLAAATCTAVIFTLPPFHGLLSRTFSPGAAAPSPVNSPNTGAQLLLDQQIKLLQEQTETAKEELRRLRDERIELRKRRIELIGERFTAGDGRKYDRILLHNRCEVPIDVALYYLDLDDKWITRGWWGVPPGETVTTDAMTRNAVVYFYAENQKIGRRWDGAGKDDAMARPVVDAKFDQLDDDSFLYEGPRTVSFYRRRTAEQWTDHVEEFECYLEAPPLAGRGG